MIVYAQFRQSYSPKQNMKLFLLSENKLDWQQEQLGHKTTLKTIITICCRELKCFGVHKKAIVGKELMRVTVIELCWGGRTLAPAHNTVAPGFICFSVVQAIIYSMDFSIVREEGRI